MRRTLALMGALCVLVLSQTPAAAATPPPQGDFSAQNAGKHICLQHWPNNASHIHYAPGCTGHDEPILMPVSNKAGSAQSIDWMFTLPKATKNPVSDLGPTFWVGGTVTDKASLSDGAYFELQFYGDNKTSVCGSDGSFDIHYDPGIYTVCSPVWAVTKDATTEYAAFNGMLKNNKTAKQMILHSGDTVCVHQHPEKDGLHLDVINMSRGNKTGTIVLNSKTDGGALLPMYSKAQIGSDVPWGISYGAPNGFSWEIGHTSIKSYNPVSPCVPGEPWCQSFQASEWQGMSQLNLQAEMMQGSKEIPFKHFAVTSSQGGMNEVQTFCSKDYAPYSKSSCTYPFWSYKAKSGFDFGVPTDPKQTAYGGSYEFATQTYCPSPFGPWTTYCANALT